MAANQALIKIVQRPRLQKCAAVSRGFLLFLLPIFAMVFCLFSVGRASASAESPERDTESETVGTFREQMIIV